MPALAWALHGAGDIIVFIVNTLLYYYLHTVLLVRKSMCIANVINVISQHSRDYLPVRSCPILVEAAVLQILQHFEFGLL